MLDQYQASVVSTILDWRKRDPYQGGEQKVHGKQRDEFSLKYGYCKVILPLPQKVERFRRKFFRWYQALQLCWHYLGLVICTSQQRWIYLEFILHNSSCRMRNWLFMCQTVYSSSAGVWMGIGHRREAHRSTHLFQGLWTWLWWFQDSLSCGLLVKFNPELRTRCAVLISKGAPCRLGNCSLYPSRLDPSIPKFYCQ